MYTDYTYKDYTYPNGPFAAALSWLITNLKGIIGSFWNPYHSYKYGEKGFSLDNLKWPSMKRLWINAILPVAW